MSLFGHAQYSVIVQITGLEMSHPERFSNRPSARAIAAQATRGYDGETHYGAALAAMLPAAVILVAAAMTLSHLLAA
jgi:hypothetical protein